MSARRFYRRFADFEDLSQQVRAWDLDFRQLDQGRFRGEILQLVGGEFCFAEASFHRTLLQRGHAPPGLRTVAIPADDSQCIGWRGRDTRSNQLICYPCDGVLDAVSQPNFHVYAFSLADAVFSEVAQAYGMAEIDDCVANRQIVSVPAQQMKRLRRVLGNISQALRVEQHRVPMQELVFAVRIQATRVVLDALALSRGHSVRRSRSRDSAVERAIAHVDRRGREAPTVAELCAEARVSERTLEYAFIERFGVGPQAYVKAFRLNGVRRQLRTADHDRTRVRDVAESWGYSHMGQFAADFRTMFGELPSVTLRRS